LDQVVFLVSRVLAARGHLHRDVLAPLPAGGERLAALLAELGQGWLLAVRVLDDDQVVGPEPAVPERLLLLRDVLHDVAHRTGLPDSELALGEGDSGPQALDLLTEVVARLVRGRFRSPPVFWRLPRDGCATTRPPARVRRVGRVRLPGRPQPQRGTDANDADDQSQNHEVEPLGPRHGAPPSFRQ